jgi:sugar phosphate isomerase/epimerase
MSKVELIASYWTLGGGALPHTDREYSSFEFRTRVEHAARAGFKGIGLWHADLAHVQKTRSLREMRQILAANGIEHVEIEFLSDWFLEPGERRSQSDALRKRLLEAAEALGARHIKVGDFWRTPVAMPQLIEEFARLCKDGENHGTRIAYEMMPFSWIDSLEKARELVVGAAAKNGGVIFDLWHIVKLGIAYEKVWQFPAEHLLGVELNDGYVKNLPTQDLVEETTQHRRFCGQGEFDVKGFTALMSKSHYTGPVGIEVLSKELRTWPLERAARTAYETTAAQFD